MYKMFTTDQVLSVSTGYLVAESGVDALYELLGHLTGDQHISTLGLAAVSSAAAEELKKQFPLLRNVQDPVFPDGISSDQASQIARDWVRQQERMLGATHFSVLGGTVRTRDYSFMDRIGSDSR